MHKWCGWIALFAVIMPLSGQQPREGSPGDAQKLVTVRRILVEGTRLPPLSVVKLAGIQAGDQVDFLKLHTAMQKVTKSGLIANVEFEYESLPDKETEVVLHLICKDVAPLATATIRIANVNEEDVWKWLSTSVDPLFTREMPPTEAAIRLYSHWIGKYMEAHGVPDFMENYGIVADASSTTGGQTANQLLFKAVKRRGRK